MSPLEPTKKQLIHELSELRQRVAELEALEDERQRTKRTLQKTYDELEQRIEERSIELVRTNEKLKQEIRKHKQTEEELKRTKDYLENVIENSADAIGIVDRQGRFILWNRRAAEIYGYNLNELSSKSAFELYADSIELNGMLARLRKDGVVREYEITKKKRDGATVPMDISISLLKDDHGGTIGSVCVARDLSERKKTEMELKRARDELQRYSRDLERQVRERTGEITNILKYTPAVVYIKDREGRYKLVNSRFEELFGVTNAEIQGKSDYDIFPPEIAEQFRSNDLRILTKGSSQQMEELAPLSDGQHTYLSVKFPLYDEQGAISGLCGISTDITELKKAQDQLRRLSASIMAAQEKERAAIARELHDELGQVLTALRIDSVWLSERLKENDTKAAQRALMMRDLIDKTIDEVRGMATRLRPGVLDDFGLIEALQWYVREFEKRTGISCVFKPQEVPDVDDAVATAAYRIAQEALTNVARHSFATRVNITLHAENSVLRLAVTDNGRGFDPWKLAESEGLGLAGMRERASLLGGKLEIQPRPKKGTQLSLSLPINGKRSIVQ